MRRYDDRYGNTRLYVGHLSSRTRSRDLDNLFSRYGRLLGFCPTGRSLMRGCPRWKMAKSLRFLSHDGLTFSGNHLRRVRDVDLKNDFAFIDFSDPRDADDARYSLNGREFDGSRIIVEFAKDPRGSRGSHADRGPPPGSGRCFNCGIDGHWARDCKDGDWKNKCYRCGERGHIERHCQNSPKSLRRGRSYSQSPSPRGGRGRGRSYRLSRSYSRSRSPAPRRERERSISRSPRHNRSPKSKRSPPPSKGKKRSPSPGGSRSPQERVGPPPKELKRPEHSVSRSPRKDASPPPKELKQSECNGSDYSGSPRREDRRSPMDRDREDLPAKNGRSPSPRDYANDRSESPQD